MESERDKECDLKKWKAGVKKKINIYDKRHVLSLQQKKAILPAFWIWKLRELKNLGP